MKRLIVAALLLSAMTAYAETYTWEDANGVHFTDNLSSVPNKYRKRAIAEAQGDITTKDPGIAAEVGKANRRRAAIEAQDRADAVAERRRNAQTERQKAQAFPVNCQGDIPGECGPGRACLYSRFDKSTPGVCMSQEEHDRRVTESRRDALQNMHNQAVERKLDNIERNTAGQQRNLDDIDHTLRYGY